MSYKDTNKSLWTTINNIPNTYPWLSEDEYTSVCIIGGGISGAMCALRFASSGIDTVLLSSKPIGFGSTSLSDGTIKADVFDGLTGLSLKVGTEVACKIYKRFEKSLDCLEHIAQTLGNDCGFTRLGSLMYTQSEDLSYDLHKEYLTRRHNGFDVSVLHNNNHYLDDILNLEFGILTQNKAAIVDPFIFTHMIVKAAKACGARVYENTQAEDIISGKNSPSVYTSTNRYVHASKVIISTGGQENKFIKNLGTYKTKFTIATKQISNMSTYRDNHIIASRIDYPEMTFSVTKDKRIVATGEATGHINENKKMSGIIPMSTLKKNKFSHLKKELSTFFPDIKDSDIEFKFCCDYLETEDGLPIVGKHNLYPDCYFNLCPGENNMIFSEMTSEILLNLYTGKKTEFDEEICHKQI